MASDDPQKRMANMAIDVAALLFECRIALTAVHFGLETLATRSTEPPIAAELRTLMKLSNQACEALEVLQKVIVKGMGGDADEAGSAS
jgi:hypothetical protein